MHMRILFSCLLCLGSLWMQAQMKTGEVLADTIKNKSIITNGRRQLLNIIEREQRKADVTDGVIDKRLDIEGDTAKSEGLTRLLFKKVNTTVAYIENNESDDLLKRKWLGKVIDNLRLFNWDMNDGFIDLSYYQTLYENTYQVFRGLHNHNLATYIKDNSTRTMYSLSPLFDTVKDAMNILMSNLCEQYPDLLIKRLRFIKVPSAADIVVEKAAPKNPKMILNYVMSTAVERDIVRRNRDPYIRAIVTLADSCHSPLKGIFFINLFIEKKISVSEINRITENADLYFTKLTEMRQSNITGNLRKSYDKELVHVASEYVNTMNELHESADAVRFKCIDKLSANQLYYVMVFGSDDLYTSSFLGCFNRLMNRMKPRRGDQFLQDLDQDKFRTFIRLCANYNTLSAFLNTMEKENQKALMKAFVQGLDHTVEQDLEGATDVANSFGSISDTLLLTEITHEIALNRLNDSTAKNTRGYRIYDILYTMLTAGSDSITRRYGIPPISGIPFNQLADDSGIVYQQVFFYGDEDGKSVFNSYLNSFNSDWHIKREDKWVVISSVKGKPIVIFANKPLDEPEDEAAQNALQDYIDSLNIRPTVIIHRGHSYHLSGTLDHLNYHHKVVILGACGAYQNLSAVLSASEDAQIISTKQIGTGVINAAIIRAFNQRLLEGKDIDWIELWAQLSKQFSGGEYKDRFSDYVPPYKNLGALFLKAFRKAD